MDIKARLRVRLLAALLAGTAASAAGAHPAPFSYLDLHLDADGASGGLVIHDFDAAYELGNVVSRDPKLRKVFEVVEAIADTRATVLITGESGTGKSQLARAIHARSSRRSAPFVVVNCGALPPQLLESELFGHARGAFTGAVRDKPGVFEAAHGGTLFLDEIACAPSELQVKLLRVLQDRTLERVGETITREVDVRVICATNQDLRREVDAGRFRADLYYRIHVVALELPALRERPGDVPLLANRFLERLAREYGRTMSGFDRSARARLIDAVTG